ncbi:MAG: arginine--tRNA ligase, partial [Bacteroidales bacterium]
MNIEQKIISQVVSMLMEQSGVQFETKQVQLQKTRKEFQGDLTLVVFPFAKAMRMSPEQTAEKLGSHLLVTIDDVVAFNVIKGFLNLTLSDAFWLDYLAKYTLQSLVPAQDNVMDQRPVVVEFSSPNTNKPLHLGHIRNNLLGDSVSRILAASGRKVVKVNLVNDRGIHICKSMLAWMLHGEGETPETSGKKGDKLVGDYYVLFENLLRRQVRELMDQIGLDEDQARMQAPLMEQARDLLRRWEARDPEVVGVWKMMNEWVYAGFDQTYARLGVSFDKIYYESDTYLLGRDIVLQGLESGILYKKPDGSVWADLSAYKLDDKLLLRADGTSVYMTQDIGTAQLRYDDFLAGEMIYVVGNEQNHHFDVLRKVLKKLGKAYADTIYHLSYGMVELPGGKMKSR